MLVRPDSVICPACSREFTMPLVEMVRRRHPWCCKCVEIADRELFKAAHRAGWIELIPEDR